jgi:hypothetical protein
MIILPSTLGIMLFLLACRYGRAGLKRLATIQLRGSALVVPAALLQVAMMFTIDHRPTLVIATAALLLVFCWLNRHRAGLGLAAAGIVLNMAVMAANGGSMPVSPTTLRSMAGVEVASGTELLLSKDRVLRDDQARLPWLGDRVLLPGPLARLAAWSIGDFLLLAGVARLLWMTMKGSEDHESTLWSRATPSGA